MKKDKRKNYVMRDYIKTFWLSKSDRQMGDDLRVGKSAISAMRRRMGLLRKLYCVNVDGRIVQR